MNSTAHPHPGPGTPRVDRPTRYDRLMLRVMNNPRGRSLHATRGRRRAFVVLHVAVVGAMVALLTTGTTTQDRALLFGGLALLPVFVLATGVLNGATRGLLELRARALDERQLAERGRVHSVAHRTSLLLQLVVLAAALLYEASGTVPTSALWTALVGLLVAHWLLPLWTAAIRQPDEPVEADEADLAEATR